VSPLEFLEQFPNHADFSRKSRVILFAYYLRQFESATEFSATSIKSCFERSHLKLPTDLAFLLKSLTKGREAPLLKIKGRYALSLYGLNEVEAIIPTPSITSTTGTSLLAAALPFLQRTISKITDAQRKEFLAEAISCLEVKARRATVILSWIAALDHMYEYVLAHKLNEFNSALSKQPWNSKRLKIAKKDDFGEIKESDFILVCRSARIITGDVRKLLDEKLGFRNSCAHPSSIAVGDSKVLSFIEDLIDNVVAKHLI